MNTRPQFLTLVLFAALAFGGESAHAQQVTTTSARIIIYGAFGTPAEIVVTGRVIEDRADDGQRERGRLANIGTVLDTLETDEVKHAMVTASLAGIPTKMKTDDDGLFRFRFRPKVRLKPGQAPLVLTLHSKSHHAEVLHTHALVVDDSTISIGIVSDFDDTLVHTYVANKAHLALEVLTKNAAQLSPVAGGGLAFRNAKTAGAAAFFYVSSSPQSFADRVRSFLRRHDFPEGAILLKNYGAEKLFAHRGYKTRRIETLIKAFPRMRFILVGDSGEADPVIYRDLKKAYPDRVVAVVIRKASDKKLPRDLDAVFIEDYSKNPDVLGDLVTGVNASTKVAQ